MSLPDALFLFTEIFVLGKILFACLDYIDKKSEPKFLTLLARRHFLRDFYLGLRVGYTPRRWEELLEEARRLDAELTKVSDLEPWLADFIDSQRKIFFR